MTVKLDIRRISSNNVGKDDWNHYICQIVNCYGYEIDFI